MVKLIALLEGGGNTRFPEKVQNCHKSKKKVATSAKKSTKHCQISATISQRQTICAICEPLSARNFSITKNIISLVIWQLQVGLAC